MSASRFQERSKHPLDPLASMSELAQRTQDAFLTYTAAQVALGALNDIQYDHRGDTKEREIEPKTSYLIQPREGSTYEPKIVNRPKKPITRDHPFRAKSCEVKPVDNELSFVVSGKVVLVYRGDEGTIKIPASELAEIEIFEMRAGETFSVWPPQEEASVALAGVAEATQ